MNPFEAYAKSAHSRISQPQALLGPIKLRADARSRYAEIVSELHGFTDPENLEIYLMGIEKELIQFQTELDFYWEGDGADMRGLAKEIEWARARVDDHLDLPRWG
jgi:hypothetical protein